MNGSEARLSNLRSLLFALETEIGRNLCADPVLDIVLTVALENSRGRCPTPAEVTLAAGNTRHTTRRFVDALTARNALMEDQTGGLSLNPSILTLLERMTENVS